jgi:transposase
VHQATVVACLLVVLKSGKVHKQVCTFGTTTSELVGLREWLLSESCTHVANLEGSFEIGVDALPVQPRAFHETGAQQSVAKQTGDPFRVLHVGLATGNLLHVLGVGDDVPRKPIRELRDLTRYRRRLVESRFGRAQPPAEGAGDRQHRAGQYGQRCFRASCRLMQLARAEWRRRHPKELG